MLIRLMITILDVLKNEGAVAKRFCADNENCTRYDNQILFTCAGKEYNLTLEEVTEYEEYEE